MKKAILKAAVVRVLGDFQKATNRLGVLCDQIISNLLLQLVVADTNGDEPLPNSLVKLFE